MASASSSRYQSRLFKFIHQQSRRLTQQGERTLRHIQIATSWSVQLLLHPLSQFLNLTKIAGKQLHQAVQPDLSQLPAGDSDLPQTPLPDTPIQRVLLLVDTLTTEEILANNHKKPGNFLAFLATSLREVTSRLLQLKIKPQENTAPLAEKTPSQITHLRPVIQAIASQLSNRHLVLVTPQNQILDILTAQQQQKLRDWIINEIAAYWHYQRLANKSQPSLNFYTEAIAFLDHTVAVWESHYLAPVSKLAVIGLTQLSVVLKTKIGGKAPQSPSKQEVDLLRIKGASQQISVSPAVSLSQRSGKLLQGLQSQVSGYLTDNLSAVDTSEPIKIQALIWAAINYFFGTRSANNLKPNQSTPIFRAIKGNSTSKPRQTLLRDRPSSFTLLSAPEDPWLTLNDLFGDSDSVTEDTVFQPHNTALPESQVPGYWVHLSNRVQAFSSQLKQVSPLVKTQKTTKGKKRKQSGIKQLLPSAKSLQRVKSGDISPQSPSQSTQVESAPDWIEIHATEMGYVKHPLEQLLAWLDRAMLWLEQVVLGVWYWLRSFASNH